MWQSVEILNVSNTLILKQIFWKTKNFLKNMEYRFLVESTKIENASFPYKTATSETNVKANRVISTKCTYHKDRGFASNYFIFLEDFVTVQESLIRIWFDLPKTQMPILALYVTAGVLFDSAFSLWVSLISL